MTVAVDAIRDWIRNAPLLSHSTMQLMRTLADPDHELRDIERIVETDSVLTARVLQVVNSAAFSLIGEITSVSRALAQLGDKAVLGIALRQGESEIFARELVGYGSDSSSLWEHSLRTAIASRELAKLSHEHVEPDLAYTCGLLHDIGKSVLSDFLAGKLDEMLTEVDPGEPDGDFLAAERRRLGVDHCGAGTELADHWELPGLVRDICLHHHEPLAAPEATRSLVTVIHAADMMAMMGGSGTGGDTLMYRLDPSYRDVIDLEKHTLESVMLKTTVEFDTTRRTLGMEET